MGQHAEHGPLVIRALSRALVGAVLALWAGGLAAAPCRLALTLAIDVSQSVDAREYRLQLDGLAAALGDGEVQAALFAGGAPVTLSVFEWSGPGYQRLLVPWTEMTDAIALAGVQARLRATERRDDVTDQSTAIGNALLYGAGLLAQRAECWSHVIDVSGDGRANAGIALDEVALPARLIVNGLAIGSDDPATGDRRLLHVGEMSAYYGSEVIRGPGAFVETALGFEDFGNAMRRKLLRELTPMAIGTLGPALGRDGEAAGG